MDDLKNTILDVVSRQAGLRLAILFGSAAAGRQTAESDLDVAIDIGRPLTVDEKVVLISNLAERTGRPIDLVDLRRAGEPLTGQILRHGVRLFGSDAEYARLIVRHVFDKADFLPYRERILNQRRQAWIGK